MISRLVAVLLVMNKFAAATIISVILVGGHASADVIAGTGVGTQTCAQFAKSYRHEVTPTIIENLFFSWAQGFMAGWNIALSDVQKDFTIDLSAMGNDEQRKFIRDYCDKHPLKNYYEAVMDLVSRIKSLNMRKRN